MNPPPPPPPAPNVVDGAVALPPPSALQRIRSRGGVRGTLPLLGPAFVAAIAYVDPGNFATNIAGGSKYGYLLLWVIVAANLMAMLIQGLSAKLGLATGRNLPEMCREEFARPVSWGLWVQAELIAMATDLAEFVGAAIALNLLFDVPLFAAGVITGAVAFAILGLQAKGYRRFEVVVTGMLAVILLGFLYNTLSIGADPGAVAGGLIPSFDGTESILLAVGILGATVMPHVVYLHSALTSKRIVGRNDDEKRRILNFEKVDVVIAMTIAGLVNMSMVIVAAGLFNAGGLTGIDTIEGAYEGLQQTVSDNAATVFGVALLASGLASTSVGTMAGQVIMQGFIDRRIPLNLRRAVTLAPALVILAIGLDPTRALVISQVVLSFGIPFALIPLLVIARKREIMGALVNPTWLTAFAGVLALGIICLNGFLLVDLFLG